MIVVLNGPSSSGKTTLSCLARDLAGPNAVALSIDDLYRSVHKSRRNDWQLFLSLTHVLCDMAASFAREGFDVIVDTVFERPACLEVCRATLSAFTVVLVRIDCAADVLAARERARGNRRSGLALDQAARVHEGCDYHLVIDTSAADAESCARAISAALCGTDARDP